MDFVEIDIHCHEKLKDILTAELFRYGYESFLDTPDGFRAYQPIKNHNADLLGQLMDAYKSNSSYKSKKIMDRNWNELWEKSFEPIEIDGQCRIRASFHQSKDGYRYEIVIDPKMSFGTGHHETTRQVIRNQLSLDHTGKSVLDVGCGTGILSILAEKKGASYVQGLDNDPYAVSNTVENMVLNGCKNIKVKEGTVESLNQSEAFDIVLANINRNVLLKDIEYYHQHLNNSGSLILSGFYTEDSQVVVKKCENQGFKIKKQTDENRWACLLLEKDL